MKKALGGEETQTLYTGCSKAEPKISPRRRPLPGGAGRPKFNQLEIDGHYLYLQIQFGEYTQFRVIVVTDPQTIKHTNRQGRLQYSAPQLR